MLPSASCVLIISAYIYIGHQWKYNELHVFLRLLCRAQATIILLLRTWSSESTEIPRKVCWHVLKGQYMSLSVSHLCINTHSTEWVYHSHIYHSHAYLTFITRIQANFPLKAPAGILMCRDLVFTLIHASTHYGAQLDVIGKSRPWWWHF